MSLAALEALIAGVKVRCGSWSVIDTAVWSRKPSRPIGSTSAGGWSRRAALAYRRYSMDYVDAEARMAKRGMWWGACLMA
jgi:hypothetical protein